MALKKNHDLVNSLKHFLTLKEQNNQKNVQIDLINVMKKNLLPRKENCMKTLIFVKKCLV